MEVNNENIIVGDAQLELFAVGEPEPTHVNWTERMGRAGRFGGRLALGACGAVLGAGVALNLYPHETAIAGVPVEVSVSTFSNTGLSVDTGTLGSVQLPNIDGLPIGVHVAPHNISTTDIANIISDPHAFSVQAKHDFEKQLWPTAIDLGETAAIGGITGAALVEALRVSGLMLSRRYRPGMTKQFEERSFINNATRFTGRATAGTLAFAAAAGMYAVPTYNPNWQGHYRLQGTIADIAQVPSDLNKLAAKDSSAATVAQAYLNLEEQITQPKTKVERLPNAVNILMVSDMHLRDMYPFLGEYIKKYNVQLIINSGDEVEDGTSYDMSPTYIADMKALTAKVPMIWVAGNHDSPTTVAKMRTIPGVIVLGDKSANTDGTYAVHGAMVDAYGLHIAGVPDPRVWGDAGTAVGSGENKVTDSLEVAAMKQATANFNTQNEIDMGITHEPVAVGALQQILRARAMASGHLHAQNSVSSIQQPGYINLNEGSTGLGGIHHYDTSPMEFSILSVAPNCQYTQVVRYQNSDPTTSATGSTVSAVTYYFKPQTVKGSADRTCSTEQGIGPTTSLSGLLPDTQLSPTGTVQAAGGR